MNECVYVGTNECVNNYLYPFNVKPFHSGYVAFG